MYEQLVIRHRISGLIGGPSVYYHVSLPWCVPHVVPQHYGLSSHPAHKQLMVSEWSNPFRPSLALPDITTQYSWPKLHPPLTEDHILLCMLCVTGHH